MMKRKQVVEENKEFGFLSNLVEKFGSSEQDKDKKKVKEKYFNVTELFIFLEKKSVQRRSQMS